MSREVRVTVDDGDARFERECVIGMSFAGPARVVMFMDPRLAYDYADALRAVHPSDVGFRDDADELERRARDVERICADAENE